MNRLISGIAGGVIGALGAVVGLWSLQHFEGGFFKDADVYPSSLNAQPSSELGDLVLDIMELEKERWWWNWKSNANIIWQDGISYDSDSPTRAGVVRVNVLGSISKVLKEKEVELGWSIVLKSTDMSAKFGPDTLELSPADCAGVEYDGCVFDPLPSLDRAHIRHRLACHIEGVGQSKEVYVLESPAKDSMLMTLEHNFGSWGEGAFLSFAPGTADTAPNVCEADLAYRLDEEHIATVSQSSPDRTYDAVAAEAIAKVVTEKGAGKSCSLTVAITEYGQVFYLAAEPSGDAPLCDSAMNVLMNTYFPEPHVPNITIMKLLVSR